MLNASPPSQPEHGHRSKSRAVGISGSTTNAGATDKLSYDLHLAGNYKTSDFVLSSGPGPDPSKTIISIHA